MYSYNPYYAQYLMHYGVAKRSGRYPYGSGDRPYQHVGLGRRIGAFFAKGQAAEYARDINQHRKNQTIKQLKAQRKAGEITDEEYKAGKKQAKTDKTIADWNSLNQIGREAQEIAADPTKKISSIVKKYHDMAVSEIPHYNLKKGVELAGRIAGSALIGLAAGGAGKALGNMDALNKTLQPGARWSKATVSISGPLMYTKVQAIGGNDPLLAATRRAIFNYATPHVVAGAAAIAGTNAIKKKTL